MSRHPLDFMLAPRSVAVIGASDREGSVGQLLFQNLRAGGFAGELYPVNRKRAKVQGFASADSMRALDRAVDLALIAVPAESVAQVMQECGQVGVKTAVVLSAGFRERGPEGQRLEQEVLAIAQRHHVRLLGPNCLGISRPSAKLHAIFGRTLSRPGRVALLSQSGAVCTALADWAEARDIGFSAVVSLGAAADVGFGDFLDYLALDSETDAILLYAEGVDHARRFMSGLRVAARMKPVVAFKSGRQAAGQHAAVSHSGALIGDDAVFESALRRAGAVRANSLEELFSAAELLARRRRGRGERLAIVTNAGGLGVMAADRAEELAVPLAQLQNATSQTLDRVLPVHWSHANPVDLIGDATPQRYADALGIVLSDTSVDGAIVLLSPQGMTQPSAVAREVLAARDRGQKDVLACFMGGAQVSDAHELLAHGGLPHFATPEVAVDAFAQLVHYQRNQRMLLEVPPPLADENASDLVAAHALIERSLSEGRTLLHSSEVRDLLRAFRIPVNASFAARSSDEAVAAAERVGLPVAMKIASPDITHKSEVGGVILDLRTADAVRAAFEQIVQRARERKPEAKLEGVTIEAMHGRPHARELLVGVVRDAAFGPAIGVGAGGTWVELLHDRAVGLPPLNRVLARDMLERTRVRRALGPFRGMPAADIGAVEDVLLRISELACELPEIEELDLNPLIADEHGVLAVDARVVVKRRAASSGRYSHLAIPPYPRELERTIQLADGQTLKVRPVRPEDAQREQTFVRNLSLEARYFRFRSGLVELTPRMLARFTQIDYDREMALLATCGEGDSEQAVGVARYVTNRDGESCEFALVIADAWQGRGVGSHLMRALIEIARHQGLLRMEGEVALDNHKMLELVRYLGFAVHTHAEDGTLRSVVLELASRLS
jgi:acetyltransferase